MMYSNKRGNSMASLSEDEDEIPDEVPGLYQVCPCVGDACSARKDRRGVCYFCFMLVFLGFIIVFPLFLKWLVTSPMPSQYWNEEYPEFPALDNKTFIKYQGGQNYSLEISDIPNTWHGCNFSCVGSSASHDSSEMSFPVHMKLQAPDYKHTTYPVLLASNDFNTWWVASDRTDARATTPFFSSGSQAAGQMYRHVTEECTRPPEIFEDGETQVMAESDSWGSKPIYALVCISWSWDSIQWHGDASELSGAEVAQHCQAIGGVCGWPCGSRPRGSALPSCSAGGIIDVDAISTLLDANFSGEVGLRSCVEKPGDPECTTSTSPMSQWPCHQCATTSILMDADLDGDSNTNEQGNKTYQLRYDSLPKMEVVLKNVELQNSDAVPHVYILTSTVDPLEQGPAALYGGGNWKKLYTDYSMLVSDPHLQPQPIPVELLEAEEEEEESLDLQHPVPGVPSSLDAGEFFSSPSVLKTSRNKMQYVDQSKVTLESQTCFASRGPLYVVACAVNQSTHADFFQFSKGQEVAPPPFNDRCVAVRGKCAYACMAQQTPTLLHCDDDGFIPEGELWQDFELPTNEAAVVGVFCWALLIGFAVKLMTYAPGLFNPDKHPQNYHEKQTNHFKYIAVCIPSGGETKACVVRNVVGALSAIPVGCECPYHVVFADEGHRHSQKVMYRAFVQVMHCVPDSRMTSGRDMEIDVRKMRGRGHYKEGNLKAFTTKWVEATRTLTLKDCETAKIAKRVREISEKEDKAAKEEVKKLNETIDSLCGLTALRKLQKLGWPRGEESAEIRALEAAIQRLRSELCAGEKDVAGDSEKAEAPKAMHLDDCEAYFWEPTAKHPDEQISRLYTLHYVARARPEEDERTLKVQHVARGTWYYKIPRNERQREEKKWLEWRALAQVYEDGEAGTENFVVPLRTSRGKAGGLNFCENYLYDHTKETTPADDEEKNGLKHALFSIADARHQFQPDFFHATIPFFFKQNNQEIDFRVAFTQSPQYFPEMPDDVDYLDTNNANFFRLNCMLRNCAGGVSSCGTNGTWLVRDRRAGFHGVDSVWEEEDRARLDYVEKLERRFFHESCKVEDTASSLDRVVKGKLSQYVNQRLSYGMAKDPTDYLAAVQRWAEGGVVLSLQTFLGCGTEGIHMIWMALLLFLSFVFSVANIVYGWGYEPVLEAFTRRSGDERLEKAIRDVADWCADRAVDMEIAEQWFREVFVDMFLEVQVWLIVVVLFIAALALITQISYYLHNCGCLCCARKTTRRTRFPITMSQWARLAITLDNLTYFLWFWTAFFWVGFNYYAIWARRWYHFEAQGMVFFSYLLQVLGWSLVITATARYRTEQGMASNEVFFLSLTNVWRTTQLFYITAPLILYSILMGSSDFLRHRMLDVDISYWVGGDRGAVSKMIAQCWTLFLIVGAIVSHGFFWLNKLPEGSIGGLLIVTFIALDVMHPCAFLWLGVSQEKLPEPPAKSMPGWQRLPYRAAQLLLSAAVWRNAMRTVVFHPRTTMTVKWLGPLQNVLFPSLTWVFPELGVNQALMLLASRSN